MKKFILLLLVGISLIAKAQKQALPDKSQLSWHNMEFYLFVHFGPNTFTDKEWGAGTETEDVFNPSNLDCRQWCRVAKAAGAKGIIITAKHHDGFCLWPSKFSTHTVRESKWENGKGDVLKELSEACKEYGLKFGVYLSPWDRNHPKYGTPEYNDVFVNMMKEIFTTYGPIWELWWDGANGEGPNGKKQVYDWKRFERTVRTLSPGTIIFSDIGPDARWCGNEKGIAGATNWNYLDTAGFTRGMGAPPADTLNEGNINGKNWIPAECDVSIRPGWFYHKQEDDKVKTPEQLFELYLKSVGRGANLLLNVPPNRNGRISKEDSVALIGFKNLREENFHQNLPGNYSIEEERSIANPKTIKSGFKLNLADFKTQKIIVTLKQKSPINCIVLGEDLSKGQSVIKFTVSLYNGNNLAKSIEATTIGRKRILSFPETNCTKFIIQIKEAKFHPSINTIEAFHIQPALVENR